MLLQSLPLSSSSSTFFVESNDLYCPRSSSSSSKGAVNSKISCCSSSRNNAYIPKLQPFSRSKFERVVKDPPLIQRSENQLAGTSFNFFAGFFIIIKIVFLCSFYSEKSAFRSWFFFFFE